MLVVGPATQNGGCPPNLCLESQVSSDVLVHFYQNPGILCKQVRGPYGCPTSLGGKLGLFLRSLLCYCLFPWGSWLTGAQTNITQKEKNHCTFPWQCDPAVLAGPRRASSWPSSRPHQSAGLFGGWLSHLSRVCTEPHLWILVSFQCDVVGK